MAGSNTSAENANNNHAGKVNRAEARRQAASGTTTQAGYLAGRRTRRV